MNVKLPATSPYTAKDQAKSDRATCFIGRGSQSSSTEAYRQAWGDKANKGRYSSEDVVFVSAEGARTTRLTPDLNELAAATSAGATLLTDTAYHRNRPYNVGERQVASFLSSNGYVEVTPGTWKPQA